MLADDCSEQRVLRFSGVIQAENRRNMSAFAGDRSIATRSGAQVKLKSSAPYENTSATGLGMGVGCSRILNMVVATMLPPLHVNKAKSLAD